MSTDPVEHPHRLLDGERSTHQAEIFKSFVDLINFALSESAAFFTSQLHQEEESGKRVNLVKPLRYPVGPGALRWTTEPAPHARVDTTT